MFFNLVFIILIFNFFSLFFLKIYIILFNFTFQSIFYVNFDPHSLEFFWVLLLNWFFSLFNFTIIFLGSFAKLIFLCNFTLQSNIIFILYFNFDHHSFNCYFLNFLYN